jgi:hypothetical protein
VNAAFAVQQRNGPSGKKAASRPARAQAPFDGSLLRKAGQCACGGGCPRCQRKRELPMSRLRDTAERAADGVTESSFPVFQRDTPVATENKEPAMSRGYGDWTLVNGFPIDNRYCFCDYQIEKELDWVRDMAGLFHQCKQEAGDNGVAADAVACKERKLEEAGIKTEQVGSVDAAGKVRVGDWPGPCGPLFQFGVHLHESVHQDYLAHGEAPVVTIPKPGRPEKQKELRDLSEVSAREYSANEDKGYTREAKYLEEMLKALKKRCTPGDYQATSPAYYQTACSELDLEMGLDWPEGTAWERTDIENPWPGLRGKCWWYLGDPAGGYNCLGYCLREEGGATAPEPGLQTIEAWDAYFLERGYERTSGTGDIAMFSKNHFARRSQYKFAGVQLWESKLSREAPLILHELKDIEGDAFGEVVAYYSRVGG